MSSINSYSHLTSLIAILKKQLKFIKFRFSKEMEIYNRLTCY